MNNKRLGVFSRVTEDKMNNNYSQTSFVLASIALAAVCLSCTFIKSKLSNDPFANVKIDGPADVPKFEPDAPLFSPGAAVVRRLAKIDPSLSRFAPAVEANERDAMNKSIVERQATANTAGNDVSRWTTSPQPASDIRAETKRPFLELPSAAMLMLQGGDGSAFIFRDPALAGALISGLKNIFSEGHTDPKNSTGGVKDRKTTTKVGVTTTFGGELVFREDGSSLFGMEVKTESVQNGVTLTSEMTGSVDGNECPNADGQVQLTIKLRLAGESGGAQVSQDLTVFVRANVNDNADLATSTMDIVQGTRQVKSEREMYIESGISLTDDGRKVVASNQREIRGSQNVHESMENLNEASELASDGVNAAYKAALTVLYGSRDKWQGGKCVQIIASSPGSVAVSSSTQIPVKVVHKFGGADVPSKLEASLSGESSVDPQLIPRTSGTLTYVAPGETGKSATIKLTATSKRGKATLDLNANTGGASYQIKGGLDAWQTNTPVCDIMKPFTLTGGGFTMKVSGGMSGIYTYSGPFNAQGTGTYTISLPDGIGKPGTMTGSGPGQIIGDKVYSGKGTEKYTLTPIEPCS